MSELLQAGLNVTIIGMSVVLVLLTLLVGIIRGMSAIAHAIGGDPRQALRPAAGDTAPGALSNQELVGVISAAIAAHRARHRDDAGQN